MKRMTAAGILLLLSIVRLSAETNLIKNGGFEIERAGYVAQWTFEAYQHTDDAVRFYTSEEVTYEGKRSMAIANLLPNDSKVIQWLDVEPDTLYRLSCWVNVKDVGGEGRAGANITVLGVKETSETVFETNGGWQYLQVYGKTAEGQRELAVAARLGFYGHLVTGLAYFDDMQFEKVKDFPGGRTINFYSETDTFEPDEAGKKKTEGGFLAASGLFFIILILVGCAIISFYFIYKKFILPRIDTAVEEFPEEFMQKGSLPKVDNRASSRKQLHIPVLVKIRLPSGAYKELEFASHDISVGGMLIMIDDISLFSIGDEIELAVKYGEKVYEVGSASVVRLEKKYNAKGIVINTGIGVRFTSTNSKHRYRIKRIAG
ncbi:MAG: PilZ domain-containing protein [Spirochaetales bacterium]|nr:PilZ domain-containing protein [Spirochaetales bacterium]